MLDRAPIVTFLGHVDHGKSSLLDSIRQTNVAAGEAGGITQHICAYKVRSEERRVRLESRPRWLAFRNGSVLGVQACSFPIYGKTSLLDSIRQTNVAAGEVGGITQHIGAYKVETNGKHVVFLDTPGHEAFTAMRARGANITDVVVLVVAADDGVMPQTEEALNHAKAANVPIVVALNKIDKPGANPLRVKQQLASLDLSPEDWGGKTQFVETSATTKKGIDTLLERLLLEAEILELKANPKNPARGVVLEAHLSEGRGVVANVLIQDGTLHQGDVILCGKTFGRARLMMNDRGVELKEAGPTTPVSVSDFSEVPEAGDKFYVVGDIQKAREIALERQKKDRETSLSKHQHVTLESLYSK